MGISRIDQPERHNHGYYVRITRDGKTLSKFFADKSNGGKRAALRAAREHEAELRQQLDQRKRRRPRPSKRNKSGIIGVSRTGYGTGEAYWQAAWVDNDGSHKNAKFSVRKYGEDKARRLAVRARREGLRARDSAQ